MLFSAHAEVFPPTSSRRRLRHTLLRTRGGISILADVLEAEVCSSPHTRRYFLVVGPFGLRVPLFSAHAEVFPPYSPPKPALTALLRTRGGISIEWAGIHANSLSSPHTRRYFLGTSRYGFTAGLFSAHAEVFPCADRTADFGNALLRTRGGISQPLCSRLGSRGSSPHTRRYF